MSETVQVAAFSHLPLPLVLGREVQATSSAGVRQVDQSRRRWARLGRGSSWPTAPGRTPGPRRWPRPGAMGPPVCGPVRFQPRPVVTAPGIKKSAPQRPVDSAGQTGVSRLLPPKARDPRSGRIIIATQGPNGPADSQSGSDAVRYMSVHSRKRPDCHGRSGTPSGPKHQHARPRKRRPRAVFAGSGRCWVRTNVG